MKLKLILTTAVAFVAAWAGYAQGTINFVTSLGSGSFTLNQNNLVPTGDNGSAAGFNNTGDSLTFNGITYTNLDFSVYNNSFIVGGRDGFQILVDKSPFSSAARLEIQVLGNSGVVNAITAGDLVTVLNSFSALQDGSFSTSVIYNNPNPPFNQLFGTVSSFQAVPEPTGVVLLSVGPAAFLAFRKRSRSPARK